MSELHTISAETGHKQQRRVPVTAKALLDMRFPFDANLSPDGKRVAFVLWERITKGLPISPAPGAILDVEEEISSC